ncbi:amidohydrolase family protein [Streptomyces sp. NPDC050844]|uniref:amidohydrolase family protein n=1 Tax=Streptomyces sp. NPDC050844 TaxID=3155790 RepID=UPI0033DFBB31
MTPHVRIDVHVHGFPRAYLESITAYYPREVRPARHDGVMWHGVPLPAWDRRARLTEMDDDHVAVEVLSAPTVYTSLDAHAGQLCSGLNDFTAGECDAEPDRFRAWLHLPVNDPDAAERELERWRGAGHIAGIVIGSNAAGVYPGQPEFRPVLDLIAETPWPLFIHPSVPPGTAGTVAAPILGMPADTTAAALSLIYSGAMDRYPQLTVVLGHYGGVLPFLASRANMGVDLPGFTPGHGQDLPQHPQHYLSRFAVDSAQGYHAPAFTCTLDTLGADRILYGSDHGTLNDYRARMNRFLDSLDLDDGTRDAVLADNAHHILGATRSTAARDVQGRRNARR